MRFAYLIEPPFNYIDLNGRVTGSDVELARHVFQELGIREFEPVQTEFAELLTGLRTGLWQMTTGLFGTDERRKTALFSRPIWALQDGLLVRHGNPLALSGYVSIARLKSVRLAVIRDQFQHRTAVSCGIEDERIVVFETYRGAAQAVRNGDVDAYASVAKAHAGFIQQNPNWALEFVTVPVGEKKPAFGAFAVDLKETALLDDVNAVLSRFLGTQAHYEMVAPFGFSPEEVSLVAG